MFDIFIKPKKPEISDEQRAYFENQFHWLLENFGKELLNKKTLIPDKTNFPFAFDGSEKPVWKALEIVCKQLELDPTQIHLDFYSEGAREINAGVQSFYLQGEETEKFAGGLYWGKAEDGKYHIWINNNLLKSPEGLVATLAHELAHARLLGGKKLHAKYDRDHELLTEIFCVFSGFGIFNAGQAFQINKGYDGWSYQYAGYLKQQSWGYLLALYAFMRNEKDPGWIKFLPSSLKNDFKASIYLLTKTGAGENFLNSHWQNTNSIKSMEVINLSGEWIKQSIYGEGYDEEHYDKALLTEMFLEDNNGRFSGNAKDTEGVGIQNAHARIEGSFRNPAINFSLEYVFSDTISEEGVILCKAENENFTVYYNGYYSSFLQAFIGEWEIRKTDEKGEYLDGSGTWEMKRKP